jgi:uncharacterized membrane protein YccC
MALATFVGSITGSRAWLHVIVLFVWSLAAGLLVAVGRRGAVVGTQAIIGIVVFGRFTQPAPEALGVAGLVLAGGLAMVMFVALVRWPSPLKLQRRAVADAYRALAELAVAPRGASTIPAAQRLDEARRALSSPTLFGDPSVLTLRALSDEGARLRIELRAIKVLLEQGLVESAPEGTSTWPLLGLSAEALLAMATQIEGERQQSDELEGLLARVAALDATPGHDDELHLRHRQAALEGQLRAAARLCVQAGQHAGLLQRRPRMSATPARDLLRADLAQMRANATLESPAGRHALRLALVVVVAEILSRHVPLQRSYWMVVAAATVLRPEFAATFTRGAERMLGTCAGVALAGLIFVGLHPSLGVVAPIIGVLGWIAYSVFPASFAVGFAFVTTLVVFLLDAVSPDTLSTAGDRLLDTLAGGAIGLLAYALWPTWSHRPARQALADVIGAQRAYLSIVLAGIVSGRRAQEREVALLARRARIAYTTAQETVARSLAEPAARQIDQQQSRGMLAALRRLVGAIHVLRTDSQDEDESRPAPALAQLAGEIDRALELIGTALPIEASRPALGGEAVGLPDLRESYTALARSGELDDDDSLALLELDEMVDAVNSLAALAGVDY